jgi:hypothetical protein
MMLRKRVNNSFVVLFCLALALLALILWRLSQPVTPLNLLTNPDFDLAELTGWQIVKGGETQARLDLPADQPENNVLLLAIPDTGQGSWVGVGQHLAIAPLQRYRLLTNYRLSDEGQSSAKLVLRVSQFDQSGQVIKVEEISNPEPLLTHRINQQLAWNSQAYTFVTDERAVAVEIGIGLLGAQATSLEIDNLILEHSPTWLGRVRQDRVVSTTFLVLIGVFGYGLGRILWPFRRQVIVNTGLAVTSLVLTLLAAEILVRFVPVNLISPDWPSGYYIPFLDGKSFRLATNYAPTLVTDNDGDRHLAMSNSLGVRDVEAPQDGSQTIVVVLGDSMTFGWAVSDVNDTWPRRLDEEIAHLIPKTQGYHFVNAGVNGYNTFQEVYLFQTLVEEMERQGLKPKIALLSFFSGIWERNFYGPDGRFSILNGVIMYTSVKQALLELASRLVDQNRFDDLKLIGASRLNATHQFLLSKSRLYFVLSLLLVNRLDENWDALPADLDPVAINYQALQSFKQVAEVNGIQPVVAYLPADNLFTPTKLEKNRQLVEQLSAICQRLDLPLINPYENMKKLGINAENAEQRLTLVYNGHYSAEGNLLYARAFAPLLADYLSQHQVSRR